MYSVKDIPVGRENAISRSDLAKLWNVSDRIVRRRIERLRCVDSVDGTFIVSHSRGGVRGYYRTDKPDEIRHFIHETRKRAANTAKPIEYARRVLAGIEARRDAC